MNLAAQLLPEHTPTRCLRLGPCSYALVPHDPWGEEMINAIGRHFPLEPADARAIDRIIHLQRLPATAEAARQLELPAQLLRTFLLTGVADLAWRCHRNSLNTVWHSAHTPHALWTAPADDSVGILRFHLPWDLLLHDLATLGGGLIHGGVAVHSHRAWLFLAPPGGGKSTTLATAPPEWQVLSDDAALLWPGTDGKWLASPLPSWSFMLSARSDSPKTSRWGQDSLRLAGILVLNKAESLHFERLAPAAAAASLYRSLNEYPVAIYTGNLHRDRLFRTAARLARELPSWRLDLPLGGDLWTGFPPLLELCA